MANEIFNLVRGTQAEIQAETGDFTIVDGKILFETNQGNNSKIYADIDAITRIEIGGKNIVDTALSDTSENPVGNKVIYEEFEITILKY